MNRRNLSVILLATFFSFCTLYVPQPLLPMLGDEFRLSPVQTSALITVVLLPLGLAPMVYGYFLQAVPARSLLRVSVLLLAIDQILVLLVSEYWQLLSLRLVQGLLMPGIFTALMSYCSTMSEAGRVRSVMSLYVATTILGGCLSRIASGYLADSLPWQAGFGILGCALLVPAWLIGRIDADQKVNFDRLDAGAIGRVLRLPDFACAYGALFLAFFSFAAILNYLPFRLRELDPDIGIFLISLVYTGYLGGLAASLASPWLSGRIGERRVLFLGVSITALGMLGSFIPASSALFASMPFLAGGFFLMHAALSGLVNHRATEHGGVINGIYVSTYYLSGAFGAWLPFFGFRAWGWEVMLGILILLVLVAGSVAWRIRD